MRLARRPLMALALSVLWPVRARAQGEDAAAEHRVKAAFLYRFASYVDWPESALPAGDAPLVIGIWGNDAMAADLAALVARRTVGGRRIEARRVASLAALAGLHMLFVSQARQPRAEIAGGNPPPPVLVVTESPEGLKLGGVVNFLLEDGQVRFEISLEAAERRGLKLSSRLVALSQNQGRPR